MTLSRDGQVDQVGAGRVSVDFFALFGARASHGRTFTRDEDRPQGPAVVVVSQEFWLRHMNAAADALGQSLSLDGQRYDVIMDTHGNAPYTRVKHSLQPGGRFLMVVGDLFQTVASTWQRATIAGRLSTIAFQIWRADSAASRPSRSSITRTGRRRIC